MQGTKISTMSEEGDMDQNAVIRGIIESMVSGEIDPKGVSADNVAQLLAAAIAQAGQSVLSVQGGAQAQQEGPISAEEQEESAKCDVNSFGAEKNNTTGELEPLNTFRASGSPDKPRLLCVKLPIDIRKKIIALRKEGKKCREIAKELKVSASGVRKVWERFLATGMVHDRKPHSGRPRKYPPSSFEVQYTSEEVISDDSSHIEYVTISESNTGEPVPISTAGTILTDDSMFVEGPLDMPGATVEIVETEPQPVLAPSDKKCKKELPVYREQLLLRLIDGCPLSVIREDATKTNNPHVMNLNTITKRSLYMESALGYPFGQIPPPRAFEPDLEQAKIILTDPISPLSKDLLAALGYSTKVYFNMCCKTSPLFDPDKIISDLPLSLGPGHLAETTQSVLQLLVNLCKDPVAALSRVPQGDGPVVAASSSESQYMSVQLSVPKSLSNYWKMLYQCASDFECCENFFSASPPSAPCLLCHPFQKLAKQLEIREPTEDEIWSPAATRAHAHQSQPPNSTQLSSPIVQSDSELPTTSPEGNRKAGRKRGRQKKATSSEDLLVIDGHFDVPTAVDTTSEAISGFQPSASSDNVPMEEPDTIKMVLATTQISAAEEANSSDSIVRETSSLMETPVQSAEKENMLEVRERPGNNKDNENTPQSGQDESEHGHPTLRRSQRKRAQRNSSPGVCVYSSQPKRKTRNRNSSPQNTLTLRSDVTISVDVAGSSAERGEQDPYNWSVEDVVEFVASIPRCSYSATFREHEVDGESLMSLDPEMMVKLMGIKTGPALKIHRKVTELRDKCKASKLTN